MPRTKRWKPFLLGVAVGLTLSLLALGVCFWLALESLGGWMGRAAIVRDFANAIEYHKDKGLPVPDSLEKIVETFNSAYGQQIHPDTMRPLYRPAGHLKNGPYIVLVEQPSSLARGNRTVVYIYPDGRVDDLRGVSEEELALELQRDDRRRAVGAESQPSSNPG